MARPQAETGDVRHRGQTAVRMTGGATLAPPMFRLSALLTILALAAPAPALAQQDPSNPFGPLPQAPPAETPTPTPPPSVEAQRETDRTLLFAIGAGLLILFVVIARVITRDARRTRREGAAPRAAPEQVGHEPRPRAAAAERLLPRAGGAGAGALARARRVPRVAG